MPLQLLRSGAAHFMEDPHALGHPIDSIEDQAVQMYVEIGGRAEALDEGDRASAGLGAFQSGLMKISKKGMLGS